MYRKHHVRRQNCKLSKHTHTHVTLLLLIIIKLRNLIDFAPRQYIRETIHGGTIEMVHAQYICLEWRVRKKHQLWRSIGFCIK